MPITLRVLLAGLGAGIIGIAASWLLTGVLFHPFQARTPETWRREEGAAQYAASSGLTLFAALAVSVLVALTGGAHLFVGHAVDGAVLGALCWGAIALPVLLSMGLFVNVHRGVITGLLTEWLITSTVAGAACGWMLGR